MTSTAETDATARAERLLEERLEETGARDPREFYRARLRSLKASDPEAYERAVRHYGQTLVPAIADEGVDPLVAWTEYGRTLAELAAPGGRTVIVDESGISRPYDEPTDPGEGLILHFPKAKREKALVVGLPAELSAAQWATYDWLVAGRRNLRKLDPTSSEEPA